MICREQGGVGLACTDLLSPQGLLRGTATSLDLAKTNAMKAGATGTIPAGHHHYAATKGAAVVEVTAMGPFAMTYVNAADDPRTKAHQ